MWRDKSAGAEGLWKFAEGRALDAKARQPPPPQLTVLPAPLLREGRA